MSTNIDTGNFPDADALAQLANEFFKAPPGGNPLDAGSVTAIAPEGATAPAEFATKVPVSVAGSGRSPAAIGNNTTFDVKDPQTSLPDPHFSDGRVPSSVAGSGRSPSAQENAQHLPQLPFP